MSIEKNIERIALALEHIVEQTSLLLEAVTEPVKGDAIEEIKEVKEEVKKEEPKKRRSRAKATAPVTEPAPESTPELTPEPEVKEPEYDQEAIKKLGKEVYKKKGAEAVYKVLRDNGAPNAKVTELKPEAYHAVGRKLEEMLAGK